MDTVTLRTARFEIALPGMRDVDAVTEACQDPEIQRYTILPRPYTRENGVEFVEQAASRWVDGVHLSWVVRRGDELVGTIGIYRIADGMGELGYWTSPWARGEGVAREAGAAVLDWGFTGPLGLARIEWRAVVENTPSARVARALGFRYEGMLRQGLLSPGGRRDDGWLAALLPTDDRTPQAWPVLP